MPIGIAGSGSITGASTINGLTMPTDAIAPGLVKITDQSFSASSAVSVNNCFTSNYDNYSIIISLSSTNVTTFHLRVRASGSDLSTSTYYNTRTSGAGTLAASMTLATALGNAERCGSSVTIIGPYQAQQTNAIILTDQTAGYDCYLGSSGVRNTTSYDGFTLFPGAGSITGIVRVYGLRN